MRIPAHRRRKAISPILATVILIAITLIAAIAIAGFVFGLFGSFTSSARVSGFAINVQASTSGHATALAACAAAAPANNYVGAQNTGTASTSITNFQVTYGGTTYSIAVAAPCPVTAGSSEYIGITHIGLVPAVTGEAFVITLTTSNGASVPISGTFT